MAWWDVARGRQSWSDYISTQEQVKGFENALQKQGSAIAKSTMQVSLNQRDHQMAIEAGLGAIGMGIKYGMGQMTHNMELGFDQLANGIDRLNADFNLVMGDVIWKLESQNKSLTSILETLQAPLDTAAKELRRRAEDAYQNGWYEEALNDFLESERKNYQDFAVHRSIGNIYLYHRINLSKALEYFLKAAKYARPRDARQAAEACFFGGVVYTTQQQYPEALRMLKDTIELNPAFYEAHYWAATLEALLENQAAVLGHLAIAIQGDPRYYERAKTDEIFDDFRQQVQSYLDQLITPLKERGVATLQEMEATHNKYVYIVSDEERKVRDFINEANKQVSATTTYAGWLELSESIPRLQSELNEIISKPYTYVRELKGHSNEVLSIAFSPDGHLLTSGSKDKMVKLWEIQTGRAVKTLDVHRSPVNAVAFMPDGRAVVSGSSDGTIYSWGMGKGSSKEIHGGPYKIQSLALSGDGLWLASGQSHMIYYWKLPVRLGFLQCFEGHNTSVNSLVFSPDCKLLASGGRRILIWDLATKSQFLELSGHLAGITSLAFNPDGSSLVSGSIDKTIILWDIRTGRQIRVFRGHSSKINSIAFHPNALWIASVGEDATARLWDIRTGQEVEVLGQNSTNFTSIAFSPDGMWLAAGARSSGVELWRRAKLTKEEHTRFQADEGLFAKRADEIGELIERRKAGLCEVCGQTLGFFSKRAGRVRCKEHEK